MSEGHARKSSELPSQGARIVEAGLLSTFSSKVEELEGYVEFFTERLKVEREYIRGLQRVHDLALAKDEKLKAQNQNSPTSVQGAWREIMEGLEREAQTRLSFEHALDQDVLAPLNKLKDTQERTRKRVKEDIKTSTNAYDGFSKEMNRLKRNYEKKCAEVTEHQRQAVAVEAQARLLAGSPHAPRPQSPQLWQPSPLVPYASTASDVSRATSPDSAVSSGKEMLAALKTKDWSGGKRHLNALIQKIGGTDAEREAAEERGGGGIRPSAVRGAKAKREAEEADKLYRQAVFDLESRRLQRERLQGAAFVSLTEFIEALSTEMKIRLSNYADHQLATVKTQEGLANYLRGSVDRISPDHDLARFKGSLPREPGSYGLPERARYIDASGQELELVFGIPLLDLAMTCKTGEQPPRIVWKAITALNERSLHTEGLYRISARHASVLEITRRIEKNYTTFEFGPHDDPHTIASVLKLYLRQLPEPLFRFSLAERMQHTNNREKHFADGFQVLRSKLRRIPPVAQNTLKMVVEHLAKVAELENVNKMSAASLAIVFQPVIMGELSPEEVNGPDALALQTAAAKDKTMEDLITHHGIIFERSTSPLRRHNTVAGFMPSSSPKAGASHAKVRDFTPEGPPSGTEQFQALSRRPSASTRLGAGAGGPPPERRPQRQRSGSAAAALGVLGAPPPFADTLTEEPTESGTGPPPLSSPGLDPAIGTLVRERSPAVAAADLSAAPAEAIAPAAGLEELGAESSPVIERRPSASGGAEPTTQ